MNERLATSRKKRRWWLALPLLVLLLAGSMLYSLINLGPELQPAASYRLPAIYAGSPLLFSASGMGYPAVSASLVSVSGRLKMRYHVLDDLCRPGDKIVTDYSTVNISLTREIISWSGQSRSGAQFIFRRRDSHRASVPCPTKGVWSPGPRPSSDGTISYIDYNRIPGIWLYTPDGSNLPLKFSSFPGTPVPR